MKQLLILIIFSSIGINLFAQSEAEKAYFAKETNDTFKHESIVIYKRFEEKKYELFGPFDYKINSVSRSQFKLNDLSAINAFSTLEKKVNLKKIEINQIKPNGQIKNIYTYYDKNYPDDGYRAVPNEDDGNGKEPELIPLEELGIGDIIDYRIEYTYTTKPYDSNPFKITNGQFIDKVINLPNPNDRRYLINDDEFIEADYAIASHVMYYSVPNELKMIQKSFNTNYAFKESTNGNLTTYILESNLIPAYTAEDYSYTFKHNPLVRYALIQTNENKKAYFPFQFASDNISKDDVYNLAKTTFLNKQYIPKINYFVKVSHLSKMSYSLNDVYKEDNLDKFFSHFLKTFCKKEKNKLIQLNKLHDYLTNNDEINKYQLYNFNYATILGRFCKKIGLKFKIMAAIPNYNGNWNDILSPYDISWGLYVPNAEKDLFVTNFTENGNVFMRSGIYNNTEVLVFDPYLKEGAFEMMAYPEVKFDENVVNFETEALLYENDSFDYVVTSNNTYKGYQKYHLSNYISNQFNIKRLRTSNSFWGIIDYGNVYNGFKDFKYDDAMEEIGRIDSFWSIYYSSYYDSRMLIYLYDEYHFSNIQLDSNVIYNDGDFEDHDSSVFGHKTVFKAGDIIHKTMSDSMLVLDLGNFITEQYYLDNFSSKKRKSDVYNQNQRSYIYNIKLEVPKGFDPINLNQFNINIENEAGVFKTESFVENGFIVLKMTKIYKFHYLEKEKWNQFVQLVQEAYNLFERKLVLVKQ